MLRLGKRSDSSDLNGVLRIGKRRSYEDSIKKREQLSQMLRMGKRNSPSIQKIICMGDSADCEQLLGMGKRDSADYEQMLRVGKRDPADYEQMLRMGKRLRSSEVDDMLRRSDPANGYEQMLRMGKRDGAQEFLRMGKSSSAELDGMLRMGKRNADKYNQYLLLSKRQLEDFIRVGKRRAEKRQLDSMLRIGKRSFYLMDKKDADMIRLG